MKNVRKVLVLSAIYLLLFCSLALASVVRISWNNNTEEDLNGYKVYYGTYSHIYSASLDVGLFNCVEIDGFANSTTYFFAVSAYDLAGNESDFSSEAVIKIPDPNTADENYINNHEIYGEGAVENNSLGYTTFTIAPEDVGVFSVGEKFTNFSINQGQVYNYSFRAYYERPGAGSNVIAHVPIVLMDADTGEFVSRQKVVLIDTSYRTYNVQLIPFKNCTNCVLITDYGLQDGFFECAGYTHDITTPEIPVVTDVYPQYLSCSNDGGKYSVVFQWTETPTADFYHTWWSYSPDGSSPINEGFTFENQFAVDVKPDTDNFYQGFYFFVAPIENNVEGYSQIASYLPGNVIGTQYDSNMFYSEMIVNLDDYYQIRNNLNTIVPIASDEPADWLQLANNAPDYSVITLYDLLFTNYQRLRIMTMPLGNE